LFPFSTKCTKIVYLKSAEKNLLFVYNGWFCMTNIGAGEAVYELRKRIHQVRHELDELGTPSDIPELITSTNLIRLNEYLSQSNEKKTDLLEAYDQYSHALEELLLHVFEIQQDLKEIVKEQSSMIAGKRPRKTKTRSKTKK